MADAQLIYSHFPQLEPMQRERFARLGALYTEWNAQINVISRKDMEHFYEHHVLHSLAIAKAVSFKPGTEVLDVGTGGGFPGIPLAIMFPETKFFLVDSIGKKIKVVQEVARALELTNLKAANKRAEEINYQFDFITCRGVARLAQFIPWVKGKINSNHFHNLPNGILALKGGDLKQELAEVKAKHRTFDIAKWFDGEYFETKKLVHLYKF